MSMINTQQSPIQSPTQEPPRPSLPLTQTLAQPTQQVPVPVDEMVLNPSPNVHQCLPANLQGPQQVSNASDVQASTKADEPESAGETEKKPWYAGIASFFESLIEGLSAIFNVLAPLFKLLAPLFGPLAGIFGSLGGSATNSTSSSSAETVSSNMASTRPPRPPVSSFSERGTGSVSTTGPLNIATGPVNEAPRASITSG